MDLFGVMPYLQNSSFMSLFLVTSVAFHCCNVLGARNLLETTYPQVPQFPKPELSPFPTIPTLPNPEVLHLLDVPSFPKPELPLFPKPEFPHLPQVPAFLKHELPPFPHGPASVKPKPLELPKP
ncbi:hypothetical protein NMG60_11016693 [Bertholletia excelsa]